MKQFLIALLIVVIAGGAYLWWQGSAAPEEAMQETSDPFGEAVNQIPEGAMMEDGGIPDGSEDQMSDESQSALMTASVSYNGTVYSPGTVTIKKGGTVTWTSSGTDMWVASAQHPTHTVYGDTSLQEHCAAGAAKSFDQCASGGSYSFTFDKVGTWRYHDHLNASAFGSVIVVE